LVCLHYFTQKDGGRTDLFLKSLIMAKPKRSSAEYEQLLQTVQMFEVIAETQPNDIQSLEILKEAYLNLDRDGDAVVVAKKIAQAYVSLGQLSSAILEYEGILQRAPDDPDCLAALGELEGKMTGLSVGSAEIVAGKVAAEQALADAEQFEDGNEALLKFFQEQQLVTEKDAKTLLAGISAAVAQTSPERPAPSLIALISERGIASEEKCLGLIAEKTRIPFLPLGSYEIESGRAQSLAKEFKLKHLVLPFDQISKTLLVATVNPFDALAKRRVEKEAEGRVQWYVTSPFDITKQLKDLYHILT